MKQLKRFENAPQEGQKLSASINFTAHMLAGISGGVGSSGDTPPRPQAITPLADNNGTLSVTDNKS